MTKEPKFSIKRRSDIIILTVLIHNVFTINDTQPIGLRKSNASFGVLWTIYFKMRTFFFKKC